MSFITTVAILVILIGIHEYGHLVAARAAGVRVDEFSIGFGRKLLSSKLGGTEYNLRLVPLGGFVRIAGIDREETGGNDLFWQKSSLQRASILFAGPLANILTGLAIFILLFTSSFGLPTPSTVIAAVQSDSHADQIGLQPGDKILSVNGEPADWGMLVDLGTGRMVFEIDREGEVLTKEFYKTDKTLGISPALERRSLSGLEAVKEAGRLAVFIAQSLFEFPVNLVKGQSNLNELTGLVGIGAAVGEAAKLGWQHLLFFTGIISINLGVVNLMPMPGLDGGRLLFLAIEKLRGGRPMSARLEKTLIMTSLALMIGLFVAITIKDIFYLL